MAAGNEIGIQSVLHSIEQGRLAPIIKGTMVGTLIVALSLLYIFVQFRGFSTPTAMDQAQIARNIARGKGFTTGYIRPLAIYQLEYAGKKPDASTFPDFYQSPLGPIVNSLAVFAAKSSWKIGPTDLVYGPERAIAVLSVVLFVLAMIVWYFVGKKLFDATLSALGCTSVLLTDLMWQFSISGLPQMLILLLFGGAILLTLTAMEIQDETKACFARLFGSGLFFGLMVLTHALVVWIFLGWLLFVVVYFRPRGVAALVPLAAVVLVVTPWLVRNYAVCGNPFGLAGYEILTNGASAESGYLRSLDEPPSVSNMHALSTIRVGTFRQVGELFAFLGMNFIAGAFFLALLHPFRNPFAAALRWSVLLAWIGCVVGMSLFGLGAPVSSNQLHILFIPIFAFYGLAFLVVIWNRLEFEAPILRKLFLAGVLIVGAFPMLGTHLAGRQFAIQWPPYVPPIIGVLNDWFSEDEVIASDMPWAVAWYSDRPALLLPESVKAFSRISDFRLVDKPVKGLFLTPVTGNLALFPDIYKGSYKDWALLITRPPRVEGFALPFYTGLPIEGECIIFSDRDRWSRR